jgi:hypothetical protein
MKLVPPTSLVQKKNKDTTKGVWDTSEQLPADIQA